MRYRLILATLAVALILAVLVLQLIGVEWLWVILNGVMQHELP
ncbi:hypothetical protein NUH86_20345 [Sphingobium sp. JS3065]|nr:hypothetical protein [Sphingobium sp. JS3065]UZW57097.1 hypothetical protein NUH86_20345 [Sphingobium sp. JS3065]